MPWLDDEDPFPSLERALRRPNGLLAAGGGLSVDRLVQAYRHGCFPWFSEGEPILWWSPDPRMILLPEELHVARSLRRRVRRGNYEIRSDTSFRDVVEGCAAPRNGAGGTWLTPDMIEAYVRLHEAGHAHSIETWIDGALVGGLYGVAIGRAFFGESMFTRVPDASKLALVHSVAQFRRWGFGLIDCQMQTAHLASFGARDIPRADFKTRVAALVDQPRPAATWTLDADLSRDVLTISPVSGE
jgi:leucyl/phenylalanyl-tRNA---protein transferase